MALPRSTPQLSIGIDLGTTNSALACAPLTPSGEMHEGDDTEPIEVVAIPQLVEPGEVATMTLLPSFLYVVGDLDFPQGSLDLPWAVGDRPPYIVGELARKRGSENPVKLVSSAKSWLSSGGASRTGPILPWGAPDEVPKLSAVAASAAYLRHLRHAWDARAAATDPAHALDRQHIYLTVPASFDEAARELTLRAAAEAGLPDVTLLEEPQAACYAWIETAGEAWRKRLRAGDLVLVCDIGGGTTDFSLILVGERDGDLAFERVAIGDHILLGGDNMDLALARRIQSRIELDLEGRRLETWQVQALWHQCRGAKEALFTDVARQEYPVTVLGKGTRLIGGAIRATVGRADLEEVLLDGFFPIVAASDMPARRRQVGLQELGLSYAADPAVTRHLARFLSRQASGGSAAGTIRRGSGGLACPTHVLFNGGVLKAAPLRARMVEVLNRWLQQEGFPALDAAHVLDAPDLDHAVARGAAYYGRVRASGRGIRIRSGAPRSYYIGIESALPAVPGAPAPLKALCVVPFGMEEGTSALIAGREFGLAIGEPAEFRFLSSSTRKNDPPGALIEDWGDDLEELGPLVVTLDRDGRGAEPQPYQGAHGAPAQARRQVEREDGCGAGHKGPASEEPGFGAEPRGDMDLVPVTLESRVTEVGTMELWCRERGGDQRWKLELNIREREEREA